MSANFGDFAEYIEGSNKALRELNALEKKKPKEHSREYYDSYYAKFNEKVEWDRKILMLMPDKSLTPEQIEVLKAKNCRPFNIWFP